MTIFLPTLVAFAAFCVWLTVRFINRRERWAKWTVAALVGVPMLCILSVGPACWWFPKKRGPSDADGQSARDAPLVYFAIANLAARSPDWISGAFSRYVRLGAGDDIIWFSHNDGPNSSVSIVFGLETLKSPIQTSCP